MTGKRTRYSAAFKARVALEALRGELTTVQLAAQHGIHQTYGGRVEAAGHGRHGRGVFRPVGGAGEPHGRCGRG